ncbi:hypothetical protein F4803DRAFT_547401 [Xylaria telfairii]|nr:hypothetical protein F4803DRAFT_547401 [Xylaria telfairii]
MPKSQHSHHCLHHCPRGTQEPGYDDIETEANPWLSEDEFFLDLIVKPPERTAVDTPFYVVARLIDPRNQYYQPRLIENGAYYSIRARAVLFTTLDEVREGPAYASHALQPEDCVKMHAYNLDVGRDLIVGLFDGADNPPPGEYLVFKLRFLEQGRRFLRLEVTWEIEGWNYAAWFVTGEISVVNSSPRYPRQWLGPEDLAIVSALMPGEFGEVEEDPTCALVSRLLSGQP